MDSRLDNLFALLEKDSSESARKLASEQIGEIQHLHPHYLQNLLERTHKALSSKNWETRSAASKAISAIISYLPVSDYITSNENQEIKKDPAEKSVLSGEPISDNCKPDIKKESFDVNGESQETLKDIQLKFSTFDFPALIESGKRLLGSSGSEYDIELTALSPEQLVAQRANINKILQGAIPPSYFTDDDLIIKQKEAKEQAKKKEIEIASKVTSSRMKNVLKRRQNQQEKTVSTNEGSMDIKTKTVVTEQPSNGNQIVLDNVIDVDRAFGDCNEWALERFSNELCNELFDHRWYIRHGAALGLREILLKQGKMAGKRSDLLPEEQNIANECWMEDFCIRILCILCLDRFEDYSAHIPVSPIREAVAQIFGVILNYLSFSTIELVFNTLKLMITDQSSWQVRHSGYLGMKYLASIRLDFAKIKINEFYKQVLFGLRDEKTEVQGIAAAVLIPLVKKNALDFDLSQLSMVLWDLLKHCNQISSATSSILDLISVLVSSTMEIQVPVNSEYAAESKMEALPSDQSINKIDPACENKNVETTTMIVFSHPEMQIEPELKIVQLFPFFRFRATEVRHSVLLSVQNLLTSNLNTRADWLPSIASNLLDLIFQNFILEEVESILEKNKALWQLILDSTASIFLVPESNVNFLTQLIDYDHLLTWYRLLSMPVDEQVPYENLLNFHWDDDEDMNDTMGGDQKITNETHMRVSEALAYLCYLEPSMLELNIDFLTAMLQSDKATERKCGALVIKFWADKYGVYSPPISTEPAFPLKLAQFCLEINEIGPPPVYSEIIAKLENIRIIVKKLLSLAEKAGIQMNLDISPNDLSLEHVRIISNQLNQTYPLLKKNEVSEKLETQLHIVTTNLEITCSINERLSRISSALISTALVYLQFIPEKLVKIINPIMKSIKTENSESLQKISAEALAHLIFLAFKSHPTPIDRVLTHVGQLFDSDYKILPTLKLIKSIYEMLQEILPVTKKRAPSDSTSNGNGTKKQKNLESSSSVKNTAPNKIESTEASSSTPPLQDTSNDGLIYRGINITIQKMAQLFGDQIFLSLPALWNRIIEPIRVSNNMQNPPTPEIRQALLLVSALAPSVSHSILHEQMLPLIGELVKWLSHPDVDIQGLTAHSISALVKAGAPLSMNSVVQYLLPALQDAGDIQSRRGSALAIHCVVDGLSTQVLPYLIFLLVPIMGRMSDQDTLVRKIVSFSFARLVRLMPLEADIPNPEGMPQYLVEQRQTERAFLEQLLGGRKIDIFHIPIKINAQLRAYQQDGVNWLGFLNKYNLHGILADDMGLGKTLQTICIIFSDWVNRSTMFAQTNNPKFRPFPSLVVCPSILTFHWEKEVLQFCGEKFKVLQYKGSVIERERILNSSNYHLLVVSYEALRNSIDQFEKFQFNYCVLDEGHLIRNPSSKITISVKKIRAEHRLILTGTPIQNNVLELWSLFDFLMPGFLGTESQFKASFSKPVMASKDASASPEAQNAGIEALNALHHQVLPFILRRMKENVLADLPPKIIQDFTVDLSPLQAKLYNDFLKNNTISESDQNTTHVFQSLQYLRCLCSHPKLTLKPQHSHYTEIMSDLSAKSQSLDDISHAPKLVALEQILISSGIGIELSNDPVAQNRVLIFSQLKKMIDIIEQDLFKKHMPSVSYLRLDGDVPANQRAHVVEKFNSDPSIDVLLLTVSVGGLGLNLTGANMVIFMEHDWNPQNDIQAMDRVHRIGQKRTVNVYRLITKGTLEEKIMSLQQFKLSIANSVVNKDNQSFKDMDTSKLFSLFKNDQNDFKTEKTDISPEIDEMGNIIVGKKQKIKNNDASKDLMNSIDVLDSQSKYKEEYDMDNFLSKIK